SGPGVITHRSRDASRATGTCIVMVGPDGERTMLPDPGANDGLTPGDLPVAEFRPGRHLHLTAYTLLREGSRAAALKAMALARSASMTVSVDASSAAPLASAGTDRFLAWAGPADILFANEDEAEVLAGRSLTDIFGLVVVKRGPLGARAHGAAGDSWEVPAAPARARDTTGAGDAFAAGFLGAWTSGRGRRESLAEGASLASRAVAVVGGRP
ncbi:MAG: carbohydrate kinase family protein, partial [bacterium]